MIIEELVGNILNTKYEAFSRQIIEDAKKRMIDIVGCAIGGANAPANSIILDLIRGWGGTKEATILVHGDKVLLHDAAMLNSIMARSYDYEATGPEAEGEAIGRITGHNCGTTECVAFSVGEYKHSTGKELISAIILGGDMATRIAVAEDFNWEYSFELTGTAGAFGATAVAGRLYGLNESQLKNAFGILVDEIAGTFQSIWDGVHSFKLPQGLAGRNAVIAVELANKGFPGIFDPLFSQKGYYNQYCRSYKPEYLTRGLGEVFYSKGQHKVYPSCYGTHTSIECALDIVHRYEINPDDIEAVTVDVTQRRFDSFLNRPITLGDSQVKALFSIQYSIANALLRKDARLEHYDDEFIQDPKVIELAGKVRLVPKLQMENRFTTCLHVKTNDGRELSCSREVPKGMADNPVSIEDVKDKFWKNVTFSGKVARDKAKKVLNMLENLEEVENVAQIAELLKV